MLFWAFLSFLRLAAQWLAETQLMVLVVLVVLLGLLLLLWC